MQVELDGNTIIVRPINTAKSNELDNMKEKKVVGSINIGMFLSMCTLYNLPTFYRL